MASGTEIFRLFGTILVDSSQAEASLGKTDDAAKKTQSSLSKVVSGAVDFATSTKTMVAAAAAAIFSVADSVASVGDTIDKQSQKLGISAEAYQEWDAILGHCGASMDRLKEGMKTLSSAIVTGSVDQVTAFKAVGLSIDDVRKMSTEDVFAAVITGLQGMEEGADRTKIATTLFGESAQELGPLLNTSAEATEEMRRTVNDLGGVMSNEAVAASAKFKDTLQDLQTAAGWFKREFVSDILPAVTTGMQGLTNVMVAGKNGVVQLKESFVSNFNSIISVLDRASYSLNKFLGKTAYSGYSSYEDYASDEQKQTNKDRLRQQALAGVGISNKSWTERQDEAEAARKAAEAAISSSGGSSSKTGTSETTSEAKKAAQVIDSLTQKTQQVADGITTAIQEVVEKYDDGTEHITKTVTESGTEIVDGVARNYKTITKYVDGVQQKVEKTVEAIDTSVSTVQTKIDQQLSEAKTKWQNGIMGTLQSVLTDLKNGNWTSLATDFAKLIWGEVTQEQRNIISKWFSDALTAINDSYSGGGMSGLKDTLHKLLTDGIASDANDAKVAVQGLSQVINGLGESGGMGAKLAGIAGNFSGMAGGITKALSGIVGFIIANPVVAAILGLTALVGGAAFAKWRNSRDNDVTNNYKSPYGTTPVYDSLAEFSARADQLNRYSSVTASPFAGSQQDTTGKQQLSVLQRISNSLDEHLPAIGTGTLVIDANGVQALAGAMQPTLTNDIDGDLGIRAARKARGG